MASLDPTERFTSPAATVAPSSSARTFLRVSPSNPEICEKFESDWRGKADHDRGLKRPGRGRGGCSCGLTRRVGRVGGRIAPATRARRSTLQPILNGFPKTGTLSTMRSRRCPFNATTSPQRST